jgi:hypothetical protein
MLNKPPRWSTITPHNPKPGQAVLQDTGPKRWGRKNSKGFSSSVQMPEGSLTEIIGPVDQRKKFTVARTTQSPFQVEAHAADKRGTLTK